MAVAHKTRPRWGVQFHPESISTEYGRKLLANFGDLTAAHQRASGRASADGAGARRVTAASPPHREWRPEARPRLTLQVKRLDTLVDPERAFVHLYGDDEHAFWLDSSKLDTRSRFSFMGAPGGPLSSVITYDVADGVVRVDRNGVVETSEESIFDYLSRETRRLRYVSDDLPFDFNCGFVGYLGYELKADCEGEAAHASAMPDAAFVFADRLIAFDHVEQTTYVLCVAEPGRPRGRRALDPRHEPAARLAAAGRRARAGSACRPSAATRRSTSASAARTSSTSTTSPPASSALIDGETYEICLTNKVTAEVRPEPLPLYRTLRRVNPAPFSAYLRVGDSAVLSSSPERFLSIGRDRWAEAKPIKGTCPRGATPAEDVRLAEELRSDEKTRAENLMIADLLRNDLGVVCEVGTVHVPFLMHVESYETVHQLVSTVRGLLREDVEPPDCIRACFPGGSMTGAPKKRTMEIIDELEGEARGVYSGAIGYFGLSGGVDLNIVIRTIVIDGDSATLGVGGAIVMQSDAEDEYQEIVLKGRAPMRAIDPRVDPREALERAPHGHAAPAPGETP